MCLNCAKLSNFPSKNVVWKVMMYDGRRWVTPFEETPTTRNKLKAIGEPDISYECGEYKLSGGAIHCYRRKKEAELDIRTYKNNKTDVVFQVIGKNPIAYNDEHIAFKEVEFVDTINDWEI